MNLRSDILSLSNHPLYAILIRAFDHFETDYTANDIPYCCCTVNQNRQPIDVILVLVKPGRVLIIDQSLEKVSTFGKQETDYLNFTIKKVNSDSDKLRCFISMMEVRRNYQRQGRGTLLLEFLESYLRISPYCNDLLYLYLLPSSNVGNSSLEELNLFYATNHYQPYPDDRQGHLYKRFS